MNERDIQPTIEYDGTCEICNRAIKVGEPAVTISFTLVFRITKAMHADCEKVLVARLDASATGAHALAAALK